MNTRFRPNWLPQISAPYVYVLDKLGKEGLTHKHVGVHPNNLKTSQDLIDSDKVDGILNQMSKGNKMEPIWIGPDNDILDGHHRFVAHRATDPDKPIHCIKILGDHKDAVRMLNKIQDIYDHEMEQMGGDSKLIQIDNYDPEVPKNTRVDNHLTYQDLKEVVAQELLNINKDAEPPKLEMSMDDPGKVDNAPMRDMNLNEPSVGAGEDIVMDNTYPVEGNMKIQGYRSDPIVGGSRSGNFFKREPKTGDLLFEIEFDNLFNGESYDTPKALADNWFPGLDYSKKADEYNVPEDVFICRLVAKKAIEDGYDGILYNNMVQGMDDL